MPNTICRFDVGEEQGVREHGEVLVGRGAGSEAQLVAARILSVEKSRSIANIMPDYKTRHSGRRLRVLRTQLKRIMRTLKATVSAAALAWP